MLDLIYKSINSYLFSLEYFYTIGESNGVYINAKMIKIDDDMMEILGKLKEYYNQFNAKWAAILAGRKVNDGMPEYILERIIKNLKEKKMT